MKKYNRCKCLQTRQEFPPNTRAHNRRQRSLWFLNEPHGTGIVISYCKATKNLSNQSQCVIKTRHSGFKAIQISELFIYLLLLLRVPLSQLQQSQLCRAHVTRRQYLRNNELRNAVLSFRAISGAILYRKDWINTPSSKPLDTP